jgi:hypothetical protein
MDLIVLLNLLKSIAFYEARTNLHISQSDGGDVSAGALNENVIAKLDCSRDKSVLIFWRIQ